MKKIEINVNTLNYKAPEWIIKPTKLIKSCIQGFMINSEIDKGTLTFR